MILLNFLKMWCFVEDSSKAAIPILMQKCLAYEYDMYYLCLRAIFLLRTFNP